MSEPRRLIPLAQAQRPLLVGIDLGGTNIKVGVVDDAGQPLSRVSAPSEVKKGPEDGVRRMAKLVADAIKQSGAAAGDIVAAGLGTPGPIDLAAGLLVSPNNLPGWWNFPLRDRVSEACGLPVFFANDANAAAYGEYWAGSGKAFHSMVMFTLGTGVGGAIIIGDLSVDGENGAGAELGHIIIDYNESARMCMCGLPGHLEGYASATAVVRRTEEALAAGERSSILARLEHGDPLSAMLVAVEAEQGDWVALQIVLETARYVGIGAASLMHTIDPNGVVIGGAMTFGMHTTEVGRRFLARVKQEIAQRTLPMLAERTTVDYASLGGDAGYIGAAGLARRDRRGSAASGQSPRPEGTGYPVAGG